MSKKVISQIADMIWDKLDEQTNETLLTLIEDCRGLTSANCWWVEYDIVEGFYGEEYAPQLAYIGRGHQEEQWFSAGENAANSALEKLEDLANFIRANSIPPRTWNTPDEHPWRCTKASKSRVRWPSCDFHSICWGRE